MALAEVEDNIADVVHRAEGWIRFKEDSANEDTDDDDGLVARFDKKVTKFQGVVLFNLSTTASSDIINFIVENSNSNSNNFSTNYDDDDDNNKLSTSQKGDISDQKEPHQASSKLYHDLTLDNKYFTTKIQIFDFETYLKSSSDANDSKDKSPYLIKLTDCHAVIIYFSSVCEFDPNKVDMAKKIVNEVQGEPRILACDTFDPDKNSETYSVIIDWCAKNEFEFIPNIRVKKQLEENEEGGFVRLIDALSAYRWPFIKMKNLYAGKGEAKIPGGQSTSQTVLREKQDEDSSSNGNKLSADIMKKIEDFDELLTKLNHYRACPDKANNNSNDSNHPGSHRNDTELLEIAQKLSNILGDDYGDLLAEDDDDEDEVEDNNSRE